MDRLEMTSSGRIATMAVGFTYAFDRNRKNKHQTHGWVPVFQMHVTKLSKVLQRSDICIVTSSLRQVSLSPHDDALFDRYVGPTVRICVHVNHPQASFVCNDCPIRVCKWNRAGTLANVETVKQQTASIRTGRNYRRCSTWSFVIPCDFSLLCCE